MNDECVRSTVLIYVGRESKRGKRTEERTGVMGNA